MDIKKGGKCENGCRTFLSRFVFWFFLCCNLILPFVNEMEAVAFGNLLQFRLTRVVNSNQRKGKRGIVLGFTH